MLRTYILAMATVLFSSLSALAVDDVLEKDKIKKFQDILYERAFQTGTPDGIIGPKTKAVIRYVEQKLKLPITGELSQSLYDQVASLGYPKGWLWGAVSASTDGAYGAVWNQTTRKEAERLAKNRCIKTSSESFKCGVVSGATDGSETDAKWVTAVYCAGWIGNVRHKRISINIGARRQESINKGYAAGLQKGYSANLCKVRVTIAADGSHQK